MCTLQGMGLFAATVCRDLAAMQLGRPKLFSITRQICRELHISEYIHKYIHAVDATMIFAFAAHRTTHFMQILTQLLPRL
jgi:hypothetical protein